jgi:penicillin-insensitive murein endopeptidase
VPLNNAWHRALFALVSVVALSMAWADEPSTCYGTTSDGRLENGWKLPASGSNFAAYSRVARLMGRTYVHSEVAAVVLEAYAEAGRTMPHTVFVYGETGKKEGGEFEPHKTHRNGLSVDFMVPVLDKEGRSVPLPANVLNKWGYDLEFDNDGVLDDMRIDFDAMAEHLYQLHRAAENHGGDLWRVIFAPELQSHLETSERWPYLEEHVEFSTKRSWVRHDEHYHVDFAFSCEPAG